MHRIRRHARTSPRGASLGRAAAWAGCALLASCASQQDIDTARQLPVAGAAFEEALLQGYLDQATSERAQEDWADAEFYYQKALLVQGGTAVEPERVEDWAIPQDAVADLTAGREALIAVLNRGAAEFAPEDAAAAQVEFDCWMEQQEEAHQPDDIAGCRTTFEAALARAREASTGVIAMLLPSEGQPATAIDFTTDAGSTTIDQPLAATRAAGEDEPPAPPASLRPQTVETLFGDAIAAQPDDPRDFLLYFEIGTVELTQESAAQLPGLVDYALQRPVLSLRAVGHTDTVGPAPLNARLAVSRAQQVRDLLVQAGVPAEAIDVFSLGESDLLVQTPDNTPEPRNRRVVVTVR